MQYIPVLVASVLAIYQNEAHAIHDRSHTALVPERSDAALNTELADLKKKIDEVSRDLSAHMHGSDTHSTQHQHGSHVHVHVHTDSHHDDSHHDHHHHQHHEYLHARCDVAMNTALESSLHDVKGQIFLRQKRGEPLEVMYHLSGFHVPSDAHTDHSMHMHAIHVHEFGDMSNSCQSMGRHFNPDGTEHAHRHGHGHAGDWGNIACDDMGKVHENTTRTDTSLSGPHSIVGRGIVIHEHPDNMAVGGTEHHHGQNARLACCTVAWSADVDWERFMNQKH